VAASSPLIAGYLNQAFGMRATLFFVAILLVISAAIFASADLKRTTDAEMRSSGK
jgi:fucose permease